MSTYNDDSTVTVRISLQDSNRTKIVKIDPVARMQLVKAKQELNDLEASEELAHKNKKELMENYKAIANKIDDLVRDYKSAALAKNKVAKPSRKTSKSIKLNRDDLMYDIDGVSNNKDKTKRFATNNVIIKENNIIIDNINDENLKINISNIINREIDKSTKQSRLNSVVESAAQLGTVNAKPTFTTPASKVLSFPASTKNEDVNKSEDEEDGGPRKRKKRATTSDLLDKKVNFVVPQIKLNENTIADKNPLGTQPQFNLGGIKANNEFSKPPSLGLGGSPAADNNSIPTSTFSFKNAASKDDDKPAPSFSLAKKYEKPPAVPAFNFGGAKSAENKPSQSTFSFTQGGNNLVKDTKPASLFAEAVKKEETGTPPNFGLDLTKNSDQETKPKFSFGTNADSKPTLSANEPKSSASKSFLPAISNNGPGSKPLFSVADDKKEGNQSKQFPFSSAKQSLPSKEQPTQPSTVFPSLDKPASRFNPGSSDTFSASKPGSRFEAPSLAEKPNSRFDPTPVGEKPLSSFAPQNNNPVLGFASGTKNENKIPAFDIKSSIATGENGTSKQPASSAFNFSGSGSSVANVALSEPKPGFAFGQPQQSINSSNSVKPEFSFGGSNAATQNTTASSAGKLLSSSNSSANGEPKFSFGQPSTSKPPVTGNLQSTFNFGQNNNNASGFGDNTNKFINNTPPNPLLQKPVSGFNFETNNSIGAGQLNFNLSNKFKSPTPPVPQMSVNLPQQASFNPSSTLNFSFSSNNANNAGTPFGKSLSPPMNSNQNPPNMMFGGFNQQQPQQGSPNLGGSAPVGRRIAKLRRR